MVVDLARIKLNLGDEVIISDRKMADNGRKGEIVSIDNYVDGRDKNIYQVQLVKTEEMQTVKGKEVLVKKPAKVSLFFKDQLRKDEA